MDQEHAKAPDSEQTQDANVTEQGLEDVAGGTSYIFTCTCGRTYHDLRAYARHKESCNV